MRKNFFLSTLFIFSVLLFQSCGGGSKSTDNSGEAGTTDSVSAPPFTVSIETHSDTEKDCTGDDCTHIELRIPLLSGPDSAVVEKVNSMTLAEVREAVKSRLPEPQGNIPLDAMCASFIEGYNLFLIEFPDSEQKWYLEITGDSSVVGPDYFTTNIDHREYLGGAHPASFKQLHSFDLKTGNLIQLEDRFDMDQVKMEAEKRFRKIHNLTPDTNLDDEGYLFEGGVFTLPENMGLTPKGLLLIYNAYEVASYAEGATRILIPYSAISPAV